VGNVTGAAEQINDTTRSGHNGDRAGGGTGVYSLGAPRQIEFGLRLTFCNVVLRLILLESSGCTLTIGGFVRRSKVRDEQNGNQFSELDF
jgi:hypothetical protein